MVNGVTPTLYFLIPCLSNNHKNKKNDNHDDDDDDDKDNKAQVRRKYSGTESTNI